MLELFLAEFRRSWIQFIRYPTEAIAGVVITTSIFYGLFLSTRYIAGPSLQFGERLDAIVVGYVLWSLVLFIMTDIAGGLQYQAQTGTLEQLFLSPFGAPLVFVIRTLASLILLGIFQFALLFLMTTPTETWAGSLQVVRWVLPMTAGAGLLRDLMARGKGLEFGQFSLALLNGIGYLILGILIFRFAERETKRRGKLSGY